MIRVALTLWFTITTLLGPGMCCCLLGASNQPSPPTSPVGQLGQSVALVKSCCDRTTPVDVQNSSKHNREPAFPTKCPCEKGKQVNILPPTTGATSDLAAQLKLIDTLFDSLLVPLAFDFATVNTASTHTSQPGFRLAGRNLLAAYSVLRC